MVVHVYSEGTTIQIINIIDLYIDYDNFLTEAVECLVEELFLTPIKVPLWASESSVFFSPTPHLGQCQFQ